ncbi:hypothetical protein [Photobacterium lutimaris]|uniref:hypothetical protein n=1 Tax=Photobacterium lutimaris TaxID=388278 RepID=UPI0010DEC752|nr:hypothetical protein [Photobacterium lutimaris]TDR72641.1 hypothetical protein DFP78_113117 [Photobacterium lutimaris]
MADIEINIDVALFAPSIDLTLLDMIKTGGFLWPQGATCVTQECDGELLWWSASVTDVQIARKEADLAEGLMPLIGLGSQLNANYYEKGRASIRG